MLLLHQRKGSKEGVESTLFSRKESEEMLTVYGDRPATSFKTSRRSLEKDKSAEVMRVRKNVLLSESKGEVSASDFLF